MVGKRTVNPPKNREDDHWGSADLESGHRKKRFAGFKDAVEYAMDRRTTAALKEQLRNGVDRKEFEKYRKSDEQIKKIKDKNIRKFYEKQNAALNDWAEVDTIVLAMADEVLDSMNTDADRDGIREREGRLQHVEEHIDALLPEDVRTRRAKANRNARWAVNINVVANIILLVAKGVAALKSSSLSLIASLLDSALDLLCTVIVWSTTRLVSWRLSALATKFPVGRRRLEPIGILVFSIIMVISFLQILQESVSKLLPGGDHSIATLPALAIVSMAGTVGIKGVIGLGCLRIKTTQVQALVQDCKTDVYFNTLSLLFPLIGKTVGIWWLDPLGAALLSLYIIYDWADTCVENVTRLCGLAVDDTLQKKFIFLAYRFSNIVSGFKSVTAYHAGDGVWVEFDILLDEATPLRRTHDIAETLQYCCEALTEVDRAFVTTDSEQDEEITAEFWEEKQAHNAQEGRWRRRRETTAQIQKQTPATFLVKLERAQTQRMIVLGRKRKTVAGAPAEDIDIVGSTGNIYTVTISHLPACTCPDHSKGNECKHKVYALHTVLKAPLHLQYQLALLTPELEEIFTDAPPIPNDIAEDSKGNRKPTDGECPICYMDLDEEHNKLVWCKAQCGHNLHESCFDQWAKSQGGRVVRCVYCRTPWETDVADVEAVKKAGEQSEDGYVNVAGQFGMSRARDYSGYYQPWARRQFGLGR